MRVDAYLEPTSLREVRDQAVRAERIGYDGVFSAEISHDPFLPLVTVADSAPDLLVGTAIAVAFARSPMTTAYQAWDLADLTRGRFVLGLGSQVRAHVVGRFSMPWSAPVERMAEYIGALRAIWSSWQTGEPLRFRGESYRLSLMTPFFTPAPIERPDIPIWLAAVGEGMCRLVGERCDGIHVHPFHTRRYVRDVVEPAITSGANASGRDSAEVTRSSSILVATGRTDREVEAAVAGVRRQIAFYASTPAYRGVLEVSGWDVGEQLHALSRRGEWDEMTDLVSDEMVHEVAVVAPLEDLAEVVRRRTDGILDRCGLTTMSDPGFSDDEWRAVVSAICKEPAAPS